MDKSSEPTPATRSRKGRESLVGQQIEKWRLNSFLGEGGMSIVYRAEHQWLALESAIKLLLPQAKGMEVARERFHQEAHILSQFRHPNIIEIQDFGVDPRHGAFMVLELLYGFELSDFIGEGPLPLSWLLGVFPQLCEALRAVHEQGFVHRDLKPANVFLVPTADIPRVKLLDFGVVKALHHKGLTATGNIVGTPKYLSPEQIRAPEEVTPASDLYALGVMLYEALVGKPPFEHEDVMEYLLLVTQASAEPIGTHRPAFAGSDLEALIQQLLAKDPRQRPGSARSVGQRLGEAASLRDPLDDLEARRRLQKKLRQAFELASGEFTPAARTSPFGRAAIRRPSTSKPGSRSKPGSSQPQQAPASKPASPPQEADVPAAPAVEAPRRGAAWGGLVLALALALAGVGAWWWGKRPVTPAPGPAPARLAGLAISPLKPWAEQGQRAFQAKAYPKAIALWSKVLQHPKWPSSAYHPKLYRALGVAHLRLQQRRKALSYFLRYKG